MPCQHCNQEPGSGYVDQTTHEQRINAKNTQIATLRTDLQTAQTKVDDYDRLKTDHDTLQASHTKLSTRQKNFEAMVDAKITNPKALRYAQLAHEEAMEGVNKKDQVDFATWLKGDDAKAHPSLKAYYAEQTATTPKGDQPPGNGGDTPPAGNGGPSTPPNNPNVDKGTKDPPNNTRMSPAELQAYFNSPTYQNMKPEEQAAKHAELRAQYAGQNAQQPNHTGTMP